MNPQDKALSDGQQQLIDSILSVLRVAASDKQRSDLQTEIARYAIGVMDICRAGSFQPDPTLMDAGNERIRHIFVEIANGRGQHGGFLCSFAEAVQRADPENLAMLRHVIEKYGLEKYLDNFGRPA
jgi:hypothetical protein